MAVAIVLTCPQDVRLIHWAARLARARQDGLVLFWALQRRGATKICSSRDGQEVPKELKPSCDELDDGIFRLFNESIVEQDPDGSESEPQLPLEVIAVTSAQLHLDLEQEVDKLDIDCLIIPRDPTVRSGTPEAIVHDHLLKHTPCEIVFLIPGRTDAGECRRIVTPVGEGPHSASCLRMANEISEVSGANLTALHIEPEIDVTASQAAHQILTKTVDRALGKEQERVTKQVVLASDVVEGIKEALDDSTDLIILGMKRSGLSKRFSSQGIADKLVNSNPGPAIAVVQSAIPLTSRVGRWFDALVQGNVPQLPRDQRVSLVERIQRSSRWDFDFILLICLSTLIAAGGLIQNSPAVVIGAMLVAPLMTPLLGTGLSITQGNLLLFRGTLWTVLRGFIVAFFVSWIVGMLAAERVTPEMAARGSTFVLDILVAMVGGIAAAYASGRPNLSSALPGVAIAASLVPPIATSGIAASIGDFSLAILAALLFFTNIVAIVLGTWIAFRGVGIRGTHEHSDFNRWAWCAGAALLLLVLTLGIIDSMPQRANTQNLLRKQLNALAAEDQWTCSDVNVERVGGSRTLTVHLQSAHAIDEGRLAKIRTAVNEAFDDPPDVKFVTTVE